MENDGDKPSENSAPNSVPMREVNGGLLRSGNPGNKGGGRKPSKFIRMARRVFREKRGISTIGKILEDKDAQHKDVIQAAKLLAEWGYSDDLKTKVEVSGPGGGPIQTSGVMVVPGIAPQSTWEESASTQQKQLREGTRTPDPQD